MTIKPGQMLLHFRFVDKIGEGGMGVVWKAVDTTLDREVAIKILPENFATEPERLARFEREARVLASLNHPHIAGIFGIHEAEGQRFISMELIPGEDLSDALDRGRLPIEQALQIAREIAEALEVAHESGVIHRDLKPANVWLNSEGKAKVLDFGLAKAYDPTTASDPMQSQTMTSAGTVAGLILGTASYMSPEQASGQPTDRRADIWSFGVLLHEMLSGKRMFAGETISHTLADVLRAPISMDDLPGDIPPAMSRLIDRCLTRDKMRRLRDIGEARIAIEDAISGPEGAEASVIVPASSSRVPWIVAGLAGLLAAMALIWNPGEKPASQPTRRFALEVPNSGNTRQGDGRAITISPDGRRVVTMGGAGAESILYLRSIDEFEARPVEGTAGAGAPIFSPDGRWIAFQEGATFQKVRATGGPSTVLATAPPGNTGASWGVDNHIYYVSQGELWKVSADGGEPEKLVVYANEAGRRINFPSMLPGGKAIICNSSAEDGEASRLVVLDLDSMELKDLETSGSDPRYVASGHILFAQGDSILVAPFDLKRLQFSGPTQRVLARAWVDEGQMQLDVSTEGTVVYLPSSRDEMQALMNVGLDGQVTSVLPEEMPFSSFNDVRISRDGRRVLVSVEGNAIWMVDLDTQTPTLMTESGFYPQWSPDGTEIIYGSARSDSFNIYRRPVDLSRPEEIILDVENSLRSAGWTRQGIVVIREEIPGKGMDLFYIEDINNPTMISLMDGEDDEIAPVVSNDGQWMSYVSDYSGSDEVYVTSFPETGARHRVSARGGTSPTWAPNGKTLYYFEGAAMIAVSIETEPRFRVTSREKLFEGGYVQYRWARQHDMHPDGDHFILIQNPARGNIEVVTNWFQELQASEN